MSAHILALVDAILRPFVREPITGRTASQDFGPPLPVRYPALQGFTDRQLIMNDRALLVAAAQLHDEATIREAMRAEVPR